MSITSALNTANTGLAAASRRANIVAGNVANALTPGYSRRDISVSENVIAGRGAGVTVNGVLRATDQALTNDRRISESALNREQATATTYATFNAALGEPGDSFGLFAQYQNLESALRTLSVTPESQPLQSQVLDAAKSLSSTFNQLSNQVQTTRLDADTGIARQVDFVNNTLKQIEALNKQIGIASAGGQDSAALEDQRKTLIDDVSSIIPVREVARNNNKIDLMTPEGVFLLATTAREISFSPANGMTPDGTLASGDLSGLSVAGVDITPGTGGSLSSRQGSLAGLFQIRDEIAPEFQTKLDGLARDVIERFEGADVTLAPGAPGLFTDAGSAFDATMESGLSGRIAINAAVDPAQGGELWRLRDGIGATAEGAAGNADIIFTLLDSLTALRPPPAGTGLSGQLSAIDAAANVTSLIGAARISAEVQVAATAARYESLLDAETSVTAVDTDQELQKLLIIERSFSANARVIQTADQMIRKLLEL
jgi:flagellar hook-associated protein 1